MDYTWNDIERYLRNRLSKTETILTFGTIGSKNISNDIDIIITKNFTAKYANFYREIHKIFSDLDSYMINTYDSHALKFVKLCHQDEALYLSRYKPKDLALHVMSYVSYPQMYKDWNWALGPDDNIHLILDQYDLLFGKKEMLYSKDFSQSKLNEHLLLNLSQLDVINLNYPEELFKQKMNHAYSYISKHTDIDFKTLNNREEIINRFYEVCNLLEI